MSNLVHGFLAKSVAHAIVNGQLATPTHQKEVDLTEQPYEPQGTYADPEWGWDSHDAYVEESRRLDDLYDDPHNDHDSKEDLMAFNDDMVGCYDHDDLDPPSEPEIPYECRAESDEEALEEEDFALNDEAKNHPEMRRRPVGHRMRHNRAMRIKRENSDNSEGYQKSKLWGYYPSIEYNDDSTNEYFTHDFKRRAKKTKGIETEAVNTRVSFPSWKDVRYNQAFRRKNAGLRSDKQLWADYAEISQNTINYSGHDFGVEQYVDDDYDIMDAMYADYEQLERQDLIYDGYDEQYYAEQEKELEFQRMEEYDQPEYYGASLDPLENHYWQEIAQERNDLEDHHDNTCAFAEELNYTRWQEDEDRFPDYLEPEDIYSPDSDELDEEANELYHELRC